ncbi:MAG: hypothetical protein NXI04_08730 [Planctomycetaceae bacterium]|nr:hypothetical protein [Planctomycetaceae bacterium]
MTILRQRYTACVALLAAAAMLTVSCLDVTADEQPPSGARLRNEQESISGRYARFERVLTQMADILGYEDPERAELLRRAISESREKGIALTLEQIAKDLGRSEFGNAIDKQKSVTTDLRELLKLLQSEDRMSAVERERQRIADLLNDVNNLKARQRAVRARTQNSAAPSSAAPGQQQAQEDAEDILGEMNEHDGTGDSETTDGEPKDGEPADGSSGSNSPSESGENGSPNGDSKPPAEGASPGEGDPQDEPKDGEPKDGEPKDGESGKTGDTQKSGGDSSAKPQDSSQTPSGQNGSGNESESQDSSSQSSPSSPSQSGSSDNQTEQTPGKEQLKTASNLMMEALDELREQEREAAVAKQDEAISELQKAAAELETMLQQLREEEKEMVLATLEARFQRLLSLQTRIYEGTVDLAATPREKWLDNAVSECRELSQEQLDATQECSFTTSLLREDGTSVSILVAVEDIETDMGAIAERLQQTKVGPLTQSMETDVIEALKELIEATQREMAEMKEQQNQSPPPQQDPNAQKPPLVQFMEEIKVLRSLQQRVNRRTRQVNGLLDEVTPDDVEDLKAQLDELARRQERLRQSALKLAEQMEKQ